MAWAAGVYYLVCFAIKLINYHEDKHNMLSFRWFVDLVASTDMLINSCVPGLVAHINEFHTPIKWLSTIGAGDKCQEQQVRFTDGGFIPKEK